MRARDVLEQLQVADRALEPRVAWRAGRGRVNVPGASLRGSGPMVVGFVADELIRLSEGRSRVDEPEP